MEIVWIFTGNSREIQFSYTVLIIDNCSYRVIFYLDKKDEIYHYNSKEHPKISKIAKFGCEML
jgi:hypothetical protein